MKATRKSRFSLGMKIVCILSCLTLFTMGFASWWIVKMPDQKTSTGSFEVYTVVNKNVDVTLANETAPTIIFGKPANPGTAKWLVASEAVNTESLTATISFDITVKDDAALSADTTVADMLSSVTINLAVPDANAMGTAVTQKYLKTPTLTYKVGNGSAQNVTYSNGTFNQVITLNESNANSNSVTVTLTLTFAWGDAFKSNTTNLNPYDFFNALEYDENTNVTGQTKAANLAAKEVLQAIQALSGATNKYTLTIDATAAQ